MDAAVETQSHSEQQQTEKHRLEWGFAFGTPKSSAKIRMTYDDFRVTERAAFEPSGQGEFLYMKIQKRGSNTHWVADRLADIANVHPREIGYAGLKDRNAVTTQWFSVPVAPDRNPTWSILASEGIDIIETSRHDSKLRPGMLIGNHFDITLRELTDQADVIERLKLIRDRGVPNYFGPQRFGHGGQNLDHAQEMFTGKRIRDRHKRGLYLSAARSYLFNNLLDARVADNSWDKALDGEALVIDGGNERYIAAADATVSKALKNFEIHPSGPMWGEGELGSKGKARELELAVMADYPSWTSGLEEVQMEQDRRALRLPVRELVWEKVSHEVLRVRFALPSGCYATSVLRELIIADGV